MTDIVDLSVALLRKFADFTKKLTSDQLTAITTGELKLTIEGARRATPAVAAVDTQAVSSRLSRMESREEARAYIDGLGISAKQLRQLAKDLGASLTGTTARDQFRDRLVEHTVGYRLNSQTIRGSSWTS